METSSQTTLLHPVASFATKVHDCVTDADRSSVPVLACCASDGMLLALVV
jgi:hypothetical protein